MSCSRQTTQAGVPEVLNRHNPFPGFLKVFLISLFALKVLEPQRKP